MNQTAAGELCEMDQTAADELYEAFAMLAGSDPDNCSYPKVSERERERAGVGWSLYTLQSPNVPSHDLNMQIDLCQG